MEFLLMHQKNEKVGWVRVFFWKPDLLMVAFCFTNLCFDVFKLEVLDRNDRIGYKFVD